METKRFLEEIDREGWVLIEGLLPPARVAGLRRELEKAIAREAAFHGGRDYVDYAMVMCCAMYGRVFVDLFDSAELMAPFEAVLGEGCIVYANTSSSMPPGGRNFSVRIHVDCPRLIPGYLTNFGAIILLDDFTEENGATWFLPRSHRRADAPPEAEFFRDARRLIAPAGSVWFFDTRIWHSGAVNRTDRWRHSITINMCRPYMKQRLDIPRLMEGADLSGVSEKALQKLGFHAQTPASLEEYYAPPGKRKFRQKYE